MHGTDAFGSHRVDAIRADELQVRGNAPVQFGVDDGVAQRQDPVVVAEDEDVVLKDDRAHARLNGHDSLDHGHALRRVKAGDLRGAPLCLLQEIRR